MNLTFLTLIVPDASVALARLIAATLDPLGSGMWVTPLGPTAAGPITHWISTGYVEEGWQQMAPISTYQYQPDDGSWVLIDRTPGNPQAVLAGCAAAGVTVDPVALDVLYATADITDQPPFMAMERLGLVMVQPPEDAP